MRTVWDIMKNYVHPSAFTREISLAKERKNREIEDAMKRHPAGKGLINRD